MSGIINKKALKVSTLDSAFNLFIKQNSRVLSKLYESEITQSLHCSTSTPFRDQTNNSFELLQLLKNGVVK